MTVKESVLTLLETSRGKFFSGGELADSLGCSRSAVWKAVKNLQEDGYEITAVTNRGYCLEIDTDVINEDTIVHYLDKDLKNIPITVYKVTDSTNTRVRELAEKGAIEGTVVISGEQTNGRGRLGRSFYSPSDTGLYMSILLRPKMPASEAIKITTASASAVADAIEEVSRIYPEIKWVNDIYIGGKKVCGILTEASFNMENGGLEYAVLGIGVNAYEPKDGFPNDIKDIAGSVFFQREGDNRNILAAEIINRFMKYYREIDTGSYMKSYRERLIWRGEKINVISADKKIPATLIDVDDQCRLLVRYEDGTEAAVASGEISIRKA